MLLDEFVTTYTYTMSNYTRVARRYTSPNFDRRV